jgi:hypothetical protein
VSVILSIANHLDSQAAPEPAPRIASSGSGIEPLVVTGSCPRCGAAVYGRDRLYLHEEIVVRWSCQCRASGRCT